MKRPKRPVNLDAAAAVFAAGVFIAFVTIALYLAIDTAIGSVGA